VETADLGIRRLRVAFRAGRDTLRVVDEVSLDLQAGRHLALLGETGCGKSVLASAILGLLPESATVSGAVRALGHDNLLSLASRDMNRLRGRALVLIPQNPSGSLNPVFRVGRQLAESIRLNGADLSWKRRPEPSELLARVGLDAPGSVARLFPHQLSGGMAQRVVTAAGLAGMPRIIFADEPTKGLDAEARRVCLDLLRTHFGRCVLMLITHDLKAAVGLPRVAVMYAGEIVEVCEGRDFPGSVQHPYTRGLVRAHPAFGLTPIRGAAPSPAALPRGCRFAPRCGQADDHCRADHPPLVPYAPDRSVRCFHAGA